VKESSRQAKVKPVFVTTAPTAEYVELSGTDRSVPREQQLQQLAFRLFCTDARVLDRVKHACEVGTAPGDKVRLRRGLTLAWDKNEPVLRKECEERAAEMIAPDASLGVLKTLFFNDIRHPAGLR